MYLLCTFLANCIISAFLQFLFEYLLAVLDRLPPTSPVHWPQGQGSLQHLPMSTATSFVELPSCCHLCFDRFSTSLSVIWFNVNHFYLEDVMWRMWNGMYIKETGNLVCNSWPSYSSSILLWLLIILNTFFFDHCPWCVAGNTSIMWCKLIVTERTFRLVKVCFQSPNVSSQLRRRKVQCQFFLNSPLLHVRRFV